MKRIQHHIAQLVKRLGLAKVARGVARRRHKAFVARWQREKAKMEAARDKADRYREHGKIPEAEHEDRVAARCEHRYVKAHNRSIYWKEQIGIYNRHIEKLDGDKDKAEADLKKWMKEHGVQIEGNKAVGGTWIQRWIAVELASVANCSQGHRRNFYSMTQGGFNCTHEIEPGPQYTERSDCSLTVTGWCWSTGIDDPNGEDYKSGYTGTLLRGSGAWREVSLEHMKKVGAGFIVYGSGDGHHTEGYCPSETDDMRTAGHGTAAVNFGTVHLFGEGEVERYFVFA